MALVPCGTPALTPRELLEGQIASLINDAATDDENFSPHELAEMIMWTVDRSSYVPTPEGDAAHAEMAK